MSMTERIVQLLEVVPGRLLRARLGAALADTQWPAVASVEGVDGAERQRVVLAAIRMGWSARVVPDSANGDRLEIAPAIR